MTEYVIIKGTCEGLKILINARADFQAVLQRLSEKLAESNGFLEGTAVSVDVGPGEPHPGQLDSLREILAGNNMLLRRVIEGPRRHRTVVGVRYGGEDVGTGSYPD
jgi:septum site-determining protein MinC